MQGGMRSGSGFRGKEGGTKDSGAVAKRGREDFCFEHGIEKMAEDFGAGFLAVEERDVADSTADDDGVGIEDVDDGGDGLGEFLAEALKRAERGGIGLGGEFANLRQAQIDAAGFAVEALERGAGQDGFHTTTAATVAGGVLAGDRVVPPLAGNAVEAVEDFSIHTNPAADSGAEDETKDDGGSASGSPCGFGEGEAICIVGEEDFATQGGGEVVAERAAVEAGGVGIFNRAGEWLHGSRGANADAGGTRACAGFFGLGNERCDLREDVVVAERGAGVASATQNWCVRCGGIANGDLDFCAPQIDSPEQGIGRHCETRMGMIT